MKVSSCDDFATLSLSFSYFGVSNTNTAPPPYLLLTNAELKKLTVHEFHLLSFAFDTYYIAYFTFFRFYQLTIHSFTWTQQSAKTISASASTPLYSAAVKMCKQLTQRYNWYKWNNGMRRHNYGQVKLSEWTKPLPFFALSSTTRNGQCGMASACLIWRFAE